MCPSRARFRAPFRARARRATRAIERTIPASSASQPFESPVAFSRAASFHAHHARLVLFARSFIDTHAPCVRPTESTPRHPDATLRAVPSHHTARRRRPPPTPAAHTTRTRAHASFAHAHAHTSHHPTSIRPVNAPDRTVRSARSRRILRARPHEVTAHAPRDRLRRRPFARTSSIVFD
jgi:hypothetical protein